ncbi:MAG TPA: hypothetical protein VET46_00140 [Steroidobacteraceae bacterium]|nr:hypothetical protein [Steroidobacteraceae bacterium]
MILTLWGYLLICLFGVAIGLFCWLSYASITARLRKPSRGELARSAGNITGFMSHGAG